MLFERVDFCFKQTEHIKNQQNKFFGESDTRKKKLTTLARH